MYLKSLVGRAAGSVIDMPKVAAEAALVNGTHIAATEEEIMAAGYVREPVQSDVVPATLPQGYKVVRYPGGDGGFELRHDDDTPAADGLFPNMLAAYEHARSLDSGESPVAEVAPVQQDDRSEDRDGGDEAGSEEGSGVATEELSPDQKGRGGKKK